MKPTVYWINTDTAKAWYVKYGLMKSALAGQCVFRKVPPADCTRFNLPRELPRKMNKSQAVFVVAANGQTRTVAVDVSEGYGFISPVLPYVDVYFFSAFNSDLFRRHVFFEPYPWQHRERLSPNIRGYRNIEKKYGRFFHRIQPFIPLPMQLIMPKAETLKAGCWGVLDRFNSTFPNLPFMGRSDPEYLQYDLRYHQVRSYRYLPPIYDAIARDALWAWPRHRVKLHQELERAGKTYRVVNDLKAPKAYTDPLWWHQFVDRGDIDKVQRILSRKVAFPRNYEKMVASSRLNIYATGKHWGWRSIFFLSLLCGNPVMMDRPIYETYLDLDEFDIVYTANEWEDVHDCLGSVHEKPWEERQQRNCRVFDDRLSPQAVAAHIMAQIRLQ